MTKLGNMFYASTQNDKNARETERERVEWIVMLSAPFKCYTGLTVGNGLMKHVGVFLSVWRSHVLKHRASPYVAPTFLPDVYPA